MTDRSSLSRRRLLGGIALAPAALVPVRSQAQNTGCEGNALFTALAVTSVPAGTARLLTSGYDRRGQFGAAYRLDDDQQDMSAHGRRVVEECVARGGDAEAARRDAMALERRFRTRTADGRWFTLDEARPLAGHFGAIGDATLDAKTGAANGTDDSDALQALIDWALFWARDRGGIVMFGAGNFRTTRPLFVGRNTGLHTIQIAGEGAGVDATFAGTKLIADHTDGPAIAVSGLLSSVLRDLTLIGRLGPHIRRNRLGNFESPPTLDDVDKATWTDPALPKTALRRYAPYAGIAIDPFRGAAPIDGYDLLPPPAWLGTSSHYGAEHGSSQIAIERISVDGFETAFALQPCDSDGNGDFIRFRDCTIRACTHGWSIGNSQARATTIDSCTVDNVHTALTTSTHGRRNGSLCSRIAHLSIGDTIDIIDFGNAMATVGPVVFANLYCESTYRIGHLGAATATDAPLTFEDCVFGLDQTLRKGAARYALGCRNDSGYGPGNAAASVRFARCTFARFGMLLPILSTNVVMEDCLVEPNEGGVSDAVRTAIDATDGGVVTARLRALRSPSRIRHRGIAGPDKAIVESSRTATGQNGSRHSIYFGPDLNAENDRATYIDKSRLADQRIGGIAWRFTLPDPPSPRESGMLMPGALMLDLSSGACLVIDRTTRSPAGLSVDATALNGALDTTDAARAIRPVNIAEGQLVVARA